MENYKHQILHQNLRFPNLRKVTLTDKKKNDTCACDPKKPLGKKEISESSKLT